MITQKEQERIYVLSDTQLYPDAVVFMRGIARVLPPTQITGLLNVSLGNNTYEQLKQFVDAQPKRSTWKEKERHIPDFYRRLAKKFDELEEHAQAILADRPEKASLADEEAVHMELAREFIQHLLAENAYMDATKAFPDADKNGEQASTSHQERSRNDRSGPWQNNRRTR